MFDYCKSCYYYKGECSLIIEPDIKEKYRSIFLDGVKICKFYNNMSLEEMYNELQELFGNHFFQIAFYCDNRGGMNIGKFWMKIETDVNGDYVAWQVRGKESYQECYDEGIKKIKKYIKNEKK